MGSQLLAFQLQCCLNYLGDLGRPSYCVEHPEPGVGNKNPQGYQLLAPAVCQALGQGHPAGCPKSLPCWMSWYFIVVPVLWLRKSRLRGGDRDPSEAS